MKDAGKEQEARTECTGSVLSALTCATVLVTVN